LQYNRNITYYSKIKIAMEW